MDAEIRRKHKKDNEIALQSKLSQPINKKQKFRRIHIKLSSSTFYSRLIHQVYLRY
jgi:hypothetical protein